jgi:ankyrin repeat protein
MLKAAKQEQACAKQYLRDMRLRRMVAAFHTLCKTADTVPNSTQEVKSILSKNPEVYRNRMNNYCTAYQSAASGNQIKLLKDLVLTPAKILETDKNGSRLLHYAVTHPDLNMIKYLCEVMAEIKTTLNVDIKEDDEDEEAEGAPAAPETVQMDFVTGLPIIKCGWLRKSSTLLGFKTFKRRWCALTEESFVLYKGVNKKPAGYIPIEGCVVERAAGSDPIITIKNPVSSAGTKKSMFSNESEHAAFTMKADTETIAQEWLTPLKIAAGVRPFRDTPIRHLNLGLRSKWVKLFNKQERTALHFVAGISPEIQKIRSEEAIRVAAWLLENGCDIDQKDFEGKTPLQHAIAQSNPSMIAFLTNRRAALSTLSTDEASTVRISVSVLNRASMESSKALGSEPPSSHLLRAMQLKGFSYLQIHFENFFFLDGYV